MKSFPFLENIEIRHTVHERPERNADDASADAEGLVGNELSEDRCRYGNVCQSINFSASNSRRAGIAASSPVVYLIAYQYGVRWSQDSGDNDCSCSLRGIFPAARRVITVPRPTPQSFPASKDVL